MFCNLWVIYHFFSKHHGCFCQQQVTLQLITAASVDAEFCTVTFLLGCAFYHSMACTLAEMQFLEFSIKLQN